MLRMDQLERESQDPIGTAMQHILLRHNPYGEDGLRLDCVRDHDETAL